MLPGIIRRIVLTGLILIISLGFSAGEAVAVTQNNDELAIDLNEVLKPWSGDFDGMLKRRIIRVLVAYNKTSYFLDKGIQRGATYDSFQLFEKELNRQLAKDRKLKHKHLKVQVVFIPVSRKDLLPALVAGKGDIAAANLTVTEARRQSVDFSAPVYTNVSELLVTGPASPQVSSIDDLAGKTVFVRKSSSYYESLSLLSQRFSDRKLEKIIIREAPEELEDEDLLEMLNAGLIPLLVVDKHKADFWKQVFPQIKVHDGIALRTGGSIALAIRKGSPKLKAVLDGFVTSNAKWSKDRHAILAKYYKSTKYVKNAAAESERKKFLALVEYFKKYGDHYNVDWLLMAAQGYQESQLNQSVRSKVGAIGVMQVMPATGRELGVGDITKVEPNIHAGTKYMRWMIDQYYGKEPMTAIDKTLFAIASYNAGVGRISRLRDEAGRRGLDPNVWFHNVEYVAADKIGRETVTYVSNIYKYYIAYSLIMEGKPVKEAAREKLKQL